MAPELARRPARRLTMDEKQVAQVVLRVLKAMGLHYLSEEAIRLVADKTPEEQGKEAKHRPPQGGEV